MKLSKKVQRKFDRYKFEYGAYVGNMRAIPPSSFEFEPNDFEDCVVLTLKEAKLVQGGIRLLALQSNIYLEGGLIKMLQELLDNVDKQIEQSEMSKQST